MTPTPSPLAPTTLAPCPFCQPGTRGAPVPSASFVGTAAELGTKEDQWLHQVRCCCGASGPEAPDKAEAIEAWNRRASPAPTEEEEPDVEIERLRKERDDALSRVEELESEAETVSAEFEGDCWKAMRSLLTVCNFNWRDVEPDGVTAEDAREYIATTLDEIEKAEARWRSKAEAAESRAEALSAALEPFAEAVQLADEKADAMGFARSFDEYACDWTFTFGHLRRARSLLHGEKGRG